MFRIALIAALILSLPLLAGCGGDEEPTTPDIKTPEGGTPDEPSGEPAPPEEPPADPLADARKALEGTIDELKTTIDSKTQEAAELTKKIENMTVAELMNAAGMKEKAETLGKEIADLQQQLADKMAELENLGK